MNYVNEGLLREIKYQLVYPIEKVMPKWVAMKMLRLSEHEFRKLREEEIFTEEMYLGVLWYYTKEIYHWAYKYKPEVTNFFIEFSADDENASLKTA